MQSTSSFIWRASLGIALAFGLSLFNAAPAHSQTAAPAATAAAGPLRQVHADGFKTLTEATIVSLTGLAPGAQVGKTALQAGADRLLQTGLFAKVSYNFQTHNDEVTVTYHVEEAQLLPVYFDNMPWFSDSEIVDAIRAKIPFYDGHLPAEGALVEQASDAISALLNAHGLQAGLEHQPFANPIGEGDVLQFHVQGLTMQIATLTFSDPALAASKVIQQHLSEIEGKEYSRTAIDTFLTEQIRPYYLQQGYLRVKLGPPEVRLSGNPNQKLPERLPVFVPVVAGSIYQWKGAQWHGNSALSEIALSSLLGEKVGAAANGMELEAGWDRIREQYGQKGYLDVKIAAAPLYDDSARTISYTVGIEEGQPYRFGKLVLTGLSLEGERRLRQAWLIAPGATFDKLVFEEFLTKLETHPDKIFGDLPVHYDGVGHWLQTEPKDGTVDVLLDFKH